MDKYILLVPLIIIYTIIITMYFMQAKPRQNMWFGVTLPKHVLRDGRLKQLKLEYKQAYTLFSILAILTTLPLLWLGDNSTLAFSYFSLWITGFLYSSTVPFKRIHHKVAKLKRDNDWFIKDKRSLNIEDEVTRYSRMMTISRLWFVIPALLSIIPIVISIPTNNLLLRFTGLASLIMPIVLFVIFTAFGRMTSKIYSSNADVNAAIDHASRRYWSILWLAMAVFEASNAIIAYYLLSMGSSASFSIWLSGIFIVSLVPLIGIYYVHNKVKYLEDRLAATDGKTMMTDDDQFWIGGMIYNNPNDKSIMVPKRLGTGSTVNLATAGGKSIQYGSLALVAVILIPLILLLASNDAAAPLLVIEETGVIKIEDTSYSYSFPIDDIVEITLEDQVPTGFRSNGIATSDYARGNFKLTDLGAAKLYVFKKSPPYIMFKLKDLYVIYNDKDPERTRTVYDELTKLKLLP